MVHLGLENEEKTFATDLLARFLPLEHRLGGLA